MYLSEISDYILNAEHKFDVGMLLYEAEYYDEAIINFYYAMFYVARALLLKKGIVTKTHSGTINMIQIHYVDTGELDKEFHTILANTQYIREQADYGSSFDSYDKEDALKRKNCSEKFIDVAKRILNIDF